ncbi:MAG: glycosyltransferase family 4 protein [Bryobacterales bacterium]|nr:glycosyltransferase family 4 protein [Bryobacterales bacterium]
MRELNQGGIERDVARTAIHLDRNRFAPHVASYHNHGMRFEELRRAGIPFLHLPVKSLTSPASLAHAWRLCRYIRSHRIQLVHAWDTTAVFVLPLAKTIRVPAVLSSVLGSRQLLDKRSHRLWRLADRFADGFVVNCEAMRRHLTEDEGVAGVPIDLLYNGVDTKEFFPQPGPLPIPVAGASLVIGAVCALRPEKALPLLQEAFSKVKHLRPGMKLLIVGSGAELPRLEDNATRLGITLESVFVPATPEVPKYMRAIDIFVLCSSSEAFANALLEAMACGCATIGSRVGGTPEMIGEDGQRGLLFPSGDAGALAERLARLIQDDDFRRRLGRQASSFAHGELSLEHNIRRTMEVYTGILRRKGSPQKTEYNVR